MFEAVAWLNVEGTVEPAKTACDMAWKKLFIWKGFPDRKLISMELEVGSIVRFKVTVILACCYAFLNVLPLICFGYF